MYYFKQKKQYTVESRDFLDKCFQFAHNGKFYRYSSFIPDSEEFKDVPQGTTRGRSLINLVIIERDSKTGKVKMQTLTQLDFMITLPGFLITNFLPTQAKQWKVNVFKYYKDNKDKL